jgi:hypothetical protein
MPLLDLLDYLREGAFLWQKVDLNRCGFDLILNRFISVPAESFVKSLRT